MKKDSFGLGCLLCTMAFLFSGAGVGLFSLLPTVAGYQIGVIISAFAVVLGLAGLTLALLLKEEWVTPLVLFGGSVMLLVLCLVFPRLQHPELFSF